MNRGVVNHCIPLHSVKDHSFHRRVSFIVSVYETNIHFSFFILHTTATAVFLHQQNEKLAILHYTVLYLVNVELVYSGTH